MFGAADDDDLDFNPAAGSKLASLFNLEKSPEKGNASLTYTAPKQPRQNANEEGAQPSKKFPPTITSSTSATNKLSLIVVKAVISFKLEDGSYNPQGKLGVALLGNSVSRLFQLLLYKGKQQKVTTARITPNFQFTVQPHLYASFYDDHSQNWSIMFENREDAMEFTTQVAVARYRSEGSNEESIVTQELLPGSGDVFKENATVQLKLSAQPFTSDSVQAINLQQPTIECSLLWKLNKSGWDAGILGAAPGSVRAILVPLNTEVPWITSKRNEPLLIQATITSVKSTDVDNPAKSPLSDESSKVQRKGSSPASGVDSAVDSSTEDSTVRARGASIKEALSNSPRSNKASIISRMARMGQATLPLKGAIACNPSDSEETEEDSGNLESMKPPLKARPGKTRSAPSALRQQAAPHHSSLQNSPVSIAPAAMTVAQTPTQWNHQNMMQRTGNDGSVVQIVTSEGQLVSLSSQQQFPGALMSPTDPTNHMSMFMSESRIQNTEMRMNLSKFSDKIDQLMTKVDNLQVSSGPSAITGMPMGLEPNVLLSSIEKLVKDNQMLQTEVAEKNKRLDEQNERIFSLLNTNSKFLEQSSSMLEQKQLQEQNQRKQEQQLQQQEQQSQLLEQLREEKLRLGNQLASLQNQLASIQELVQALQKSNGELNQELEATRNRLKEKENSVLESDMSRQKSGMEEQLTQLGHDLELQKTANSQLVYQIESKHANMEAEKKRADDKYKNLEQQYKSEINEVKDQMQKQAAHYSQIISNLENKLENQQGMEKQLEEPKQVEEGSLIVDNVIRDVKLLMNTLHRGLNQQFSLDQSYEGAQIRTMISSVVRREAIQFVEKLENLHFTKDNAPYFDKRQEDLASISKNVEMNSTHNQKEIVLPSGDATISTLLQRTESSDTRSLKVSEADTQSQSNTGKVTSSVQESSESVLDVTKDQDSSFETSWRPLPPPPPLFHDEDDSDDWLT